MRLFLVNFSTLIDLVQTIPYVMGFSSIFDTYNTTVH